MEADSSSAIVKAIAAGGEGFYAEFKTAWDVTPERRKRRPLKDIANDIGRTLVAFANAEGGDLLVGVEDWGEPTGIPYDGDKLRYLLQAPRHQIGEGIELGVTVHDVMVDGHRVLLFRADAYLEGAAVTADGTCLWRRAARSAPVAPKEIARRRRSIRGDTGYEAEPLQHLQLEDLDLELLDGAPFRIPQFDDPLDLLQYWNLVERRNGTLVLRRAAALLLAKDALHWHANNKVRVRRIHGREEGFGRRLGSRERPIMGPILAILPQALKMLTDTLEVESRQDSLFSTTQSLPRAAVEECLVNAVVHRNYAIEGQAVEVLLFPDRVEFKSPGGLPEPIKVRDLESLKNVHRSRNPLMMRVLRDIGLARDQGEGMKRIFGAMRQVELHEPELEDAADSFIVRLSTRSIYDASTQAWIASYGPFGLMPSERKYLVVLRQQGGSLSVDKTARWMGESFDDSRTALRALERKGITYHWPKGRTYYLVDPLLVPMELASRRVIKRNISISEDAVVSREDMAGVAGKTDQQALSAAIERWVASGVLAPAGSKRWRFAPGFLKYVSDRAARRR